MCSASGCNASAPPSRTARMRRAGSRADSLLRCRYGVTASRLYGANSIRRLWQ